MKLSSLDFLKLLPGFMRDDPAVQGLAKAVEDILKAPAEKIPDARVWDRIEEMGEEQLDALAQELDIDWYDTGWDLETKRATVKSSDNIYSKRGTKWAVEQVIQDVFGGGYVTEWQEYGGKPFHFKVTTSYFLQDEETIARFRALVNKAKRCSAKMDTVEFAHDGQAIAYSGVKAAGSTTINSGFAANIG